MIDFAVSNPRFASAALYGFGYNCHAFRRRKHAQNEGRIS